MADYNKNLDELVEKQKLEMEKTLKELKESADKENTERTSSPTEILLKILKTQDKQLEIQDKQLYWIRLIGIPFLCSAVITAIYMIIFLIMKL
jgi:hypothetical protein